MINHFHNTPFASMYQRQVRTLQQPSPAQDQICHVFELTLRTNNTKVVGHTGHYLNNKQSIEPRKTQVSDHKLTPTRTLFANYEELSQTHLIASTNTKDEKTSV